MSRLSLLAIAITSVPSLLAAQSGISFTPFAAQDQSLGTRPLMLGGALTATFGPISLRGSGSIARANWQLSDSAKAAPGDQFQAAAWDADLILNPGRSAGASGTFGSLEPRLFVGYGARAEYTVDSGTVSHPVFSVGTVLSYSVLSRVRFDVEARRLVPTDAMSGLFDGSRGAWEYRAGVSFHFGKGNLRPSRGILPKFPGSSGSSSSSGPARVVSPAAGSLLATADGQVGTPYVWGATTPHQGFDCSGFVQYVFGRHGVTLPRTSREMAQLGTKVSGGFANLKPGDLMFFAEHHTGITHVAIYAGNNMMIHASRSGNGVGYDDLTTARGRWYNNIYVGGQRILGVPIEGVTLAGGNRGNNQGNANIRSLANGRGGAGGAAAAMVSNLIAGKGGIQLSDVAKRLYKPNEIPDGPDGAPKRRW